MTIALRRRRPFMMALSVPSGIVLTKELSNGNLTMMARLSPFFPAMVVFVGAVVVAARGFWAALRKSNFNSEIRSKNDEIARLQRESANVITGGDSFAWADFQVYGADGSAVNAHTMPDELLLVPIIIPQGQYPLYDVAVRFTELRKTFDINDALRSYPLGNMAPGLAMTTGIRLPHHGKDLEFDIFFTAGNGMWIQFLRRGGLATAGRRRRR